MNLGVMTQLLAIVTSVMGKTLLMADFRHRKLQIYLFSKDKEILYIYITNVNQISNKYTVTDYNVRLHIFIIKS